MKNTFMVVTSIANHDHPVLKLFAKETSIRSIPFILIGDTKSPDVFQLEGCDFYSVERQITLPFKLSKNIPVKHYARKNLGYLIAAQQGAEVIIETDDDNFPLDGFWTERDRKVSANKLTNKNWVNVYKYFTDKYIWPRGFALENLLDETPSLSGVEELLNCPIQQGLADENPDVDAIYRLTLPLPVTFEKNAAVALGEKSICPFNSQNTTWFKEAFPLMYLPSYCSFRMTDIWRSFVAQRVAWTCDWPILFHQSTVWQERNDHNLMKDFQDEIPGYNNNKLIIDSLNNLDLKQGIENISDNMKRCYKTLVDLNLVGEKELALLDQWLNDISTN